MEKISFYIAKAMKRFLKPVAKKSSVIDKTSVVCAGSQINMTTIGRYSYLGYDCFTLNANIGSFCSIADNCRIGGATHSMDSVSMSPVFSEGKNVLNKNFSKHKQSEQLQVSIGNDVWLGVGVQIKSGVEIGDGAIVGMGSIVTKNIPAYEVWAGNPARFIRKRFPDETINELKALKWWEWSEEKLAETAKFFDDPKKLVEVCKEVENENSAY